MHLPHSSEFGEKVRGQWEECFGTATTCTKAQAWRGFLFVSLFAVWLREHTSDVADDNAGASDEEEEADVDEEEDVDQDVLQGESMAEAYLRRHDPELEAYLADNGIDIVEFEDDSAGEQVELINQNADIFYKTPSLFPHHVICCSGGVQTPSPGLRQVAGGSSQSSASNGKAAASGSSQTSASNGKAASGSSHSSASNSNQGSSNSLHGEQANAGDADKDFAHEEISYGFTLKTAGAKEKRKPSKPVEPVEPVKGVNGVKPNKKLKTDSTPTPASTTKRTKTVKTAKTVQSAKTAESPNEHSEGDENYDEEENG